MVKDIQFSHYVDVNNIITNPKNITNKTRFRYSIEIAFKNRKVGITAIVIMKNPSAAGKKNKQGQILSDDTIYNVLDYLYKLEKPYIHKVTIVNLMNVYSGTLSNIIKKAKNLNQFSTVNNIAHIESIITNKDKGDIIIAAWGGYPQYPKINKETNESEKYTINRRQIKKFYDTLIKQIHTLLVNEKVYTVGKLTKEKFPPHGKYWYDFEELINYKIEFVP